MSFSTSSTTAHEIMMSVPMKLRWAGWESTTNQLQQAGWEFSTNQNDYKDNIHIALRHKQLDCYGFTAPIDRLLLWENRSSPHAFAKFLRGVQLHTQLAHRLLVKTTLPNIGDFHPVDMLPQFGTYEDIAKLNIFASPLVRTNEIVVDPNDVSKALDLIIEAQSPKQKEIRERLRKQRERGQIEQPLQFHAQIISLAS